MGWRLRWLCEKFFQIVEVPVLRLISPLFFDRKYLQGRHFGPGGDGWRWVRRSILTQRLLAYNREVPWPVSPFIIVSNPRNIEFDPDDLNNFQTVGCYFQSSSARIVIGRGSYIAPNVGIITANHDSLNLDRHQPGQDVIIGESCWIGMNAVVLPGVVLGPRTVVGAGSVVTKSFPQGHIVIAGAPARVIRELSPTQGNVVSDLSAT